MYIHTQCITRSYAGHSIVNGDVNCVWKYDNNIMYMTILRCGNLIPNMKLVHLKYSEYRICFIMIINGFSSQHTAAIAF